MEQVVPDNIETLIAKLRHDAIIGGSWASVHTSDIEALAGEIASLREVLAEMRGLAGLPPINEIGSGIVVSVEMRRD